jgi:hypothetical protein
MRTWISVALLSVSWLVGLAYYHGPEWWAQGGESSLKDEGTAVSESDSPATPGASTSKPEKAEIRLPGWTEACRESATVWAVLIVIGTALLIGRGTRLPSWIESAIGLAMCVPTIILMPWPYRAMPLLLATGLGLNLVLPLGRWAPAGGETRSRRLLFSFLSLRWLASVAAACLLAGCILLAQCLGMLVYAARTARSHELPGLVAQLLGVVCGALGIQNGVHGSTVAVFSMRTNHLLGATWELLLDPVTWCFVVGGLFLLGWKAWNELPQGKRLRPWGGSVLKLLVLVALWLPFRAALLAALYLDDVLRTDYDAPLGAMKVFWNPWVLLAMLTVPVLLAWKFARFGEDVPLAPDGSADATGSEQGRRDACTASGATVTTPWSRRLWSLPLHWSWCRPLSVALAFLAGGLFTLGLFWDPVGSRKGGRVIIEEYHPPGDKGWEWTDKPYDTEAYGDKAAYNYYCIAEYCGHFYHLKRQVNPLNDDALDDCDVLVLKTPTRPYSPAEIDAVRRYVERGGGLLLIGEHTDVFGTGTHLNAVAEQFGFKFRFDCLFGIDTVFVQRYDRPLAPHPILQYLPLPEFQPASNAPREYVPSLDFAISCSLDPGTSSGRAVILGTGLKNKGADYHADNYYPQTDDDAAMRYGAFVQLWSTRHGKGRVVAFTDSTQFSNFCIFDPGKTELFMGMLEWLNYRDVLPNPRPWLWTAGLLTLVVALWGARGWRWGWLLLLTAGLLGWTSAALGSRALHQCDMPPPLPSAERPLVNVVMDRTVCDCTLPKNGFIAGEKDAFGIFERWILRLGYFVSRHSGPEAFSGDLLVLPYPNRPAPPGFREQLEQYVRDGGKVLIVDSPENKGSTANKLLEPFGLSLKSPIPESGKLVTRAKWPSVPITAASTVSGGKAFAWLGKRPVAASVSCGNGSVTVIGFGSRFTDANMGITGDLVPNAELRAVYDVQFSLFRAIMGGTLPGPDKK